MIKVEEKTVTAICTEDSVTEHYGFLWLNSRKEKIQGLTAGKVYEVLETNTTFVGHVYCYYAFTNLVIKNDLGEKQICSLNNFKFGK